MEKIIILLDLLSTPRGTKKVYNLSTLLFKLIDLLFLKVRKSFTNCKNLSFHWDNQL